MRLTCIRPTARSWENSPAYRRMVSNRCVQSVSAYSTTYPAYKKLFGRAADAAQKSGLRVETALLCGAGQSREEIELTLDCFPAVREIHVIDWHEPNLMFLKRELEAYRPGRADLSLTLHLANLMNPETVPRDHIHFAFANKLFDLYADNEFDTQRLLAGIATVLSIRGIFYSCDHPFSYAGDHPFYELAQDIGLEKIADRILLRTR